MQTSQFASQAAVTIPLVPCRASDLAQIYPASAGDNATVSAHIAANQFLCPNLPQGISVLNQFDSPLSVVLNVYLSACSITVNPNCVFDASRRAFFDGKQVMLLTNTNLIQNTQHVITSPV